MAFGHVGTIGAVGATTNNQTSLVLTTSAAVEAGNLVVLVIAVDNNQTTDGASNAVSGVTNSGTNANWQEIVEFTNGQGVTQAGAAVAIWWAVPTVTIASGATITATFTTSATSDASAMIGREFTKDANSNVEVAATNTLANDAADPGALDAVTPNIACLRVRGIASEGAASGNAPALTPTATWTAWADGNSVLAMTAAEMYARAEHLISTGTGASSNPTSWAADSASSYVAFREVDILMGQVVM